MIEKPTIILTSLGRTGTLFFTRFFDDLLPNATALHEPDFLNFGQYKGWHEKAKQVRRQIGESGLINLLVRKALGQWDLVRLSHARVRGELSETSAINQVSRQRKQFVSSRYGEIYVECSTACYGLVDIFPHVYAQHRLIYMVRDGRDWVRSKMNFGNTYAKKNPVRDSLTIHWPTAVEVPNDPYATRWQSMSRFGRLCWAWTTLNRYALTTLKDNRDARCFHFEDIFKSPDRERKLEEMVQFAGEYIDNFPNFSSVDHYLFRPVHQSKKRFPKWEAWTTTQREEFETICGPLMRELGYF